MKILAFTDPHAQYEDLQIMATKSKAAEIILCLGDLAMFGTGLESTLDFLESLNKPVFVIHGNEPHESLTEVKEGCKKRKNLLFINNKYMVYKDVLIIGHGGGGFSSRTTQFENKSPEFIQAIKLSSKSILMTHAPPYNTKLDALGKGYHCGNQTYRNFIQLAQPTIALCGHIHEAFGKKDKIGKTILINPGPLGMLINI